MEIRSNSTKARLGNLQPVEILDPAHRVIGFGLSNHGSLAAFDDGGFNYATLQLGSGEKQLQHPGLSTDWTGTGSFQPAIEMLPILALSHLTV